MTRSESSSPSSEPSRYVQRRSGETTNGALHVIRSNCSPATGSKRLPRAALDVLEAAERCVQLGEREGARVDVGRDDMFAVTGGEQGVHAVPGSDVEGARDAGRGVSRSHSRAVGE